MSLRVVPLRVTNGVFTNYTYLVMDEDSRSAFLVDPAWESARIEEEMTQCGAVLSGILLTHSHFDHTDLAAGLAQKFGVGIWISRLEAALHDFSAPNLHLLDDQEEFTVGAMRVTALLTPGHTGGSVCYLASGHLFSGDTLFAEGCGICTCEGGDPRAMFHSLQRLKRELAPDCRVFPGHCFGEPPGRTFAEIMKRNVYLAFDREDLFTRFRMRPGQGSAMDFV